MEKKLNTYQILINNKNIINEFIPSEESDVWLKELADMYDYQVPLYKSLKSFSPDTTAVKIKKLKKLKKHIRSVMFAFDDLDTHSKHKFMSQLIQEQKTFKAHIPSTEQDFYDNLTLFIRTSGALYNSLKPRIGIQDPYRSKYRNDFIFEIILDKWKSLNYEVKTGTDSRLVKFGDCICNILFIRASSFREYLIRGVNKKNKSG